MANLTDTTVSKIDTINIIPSTAMLTTAVLNSATINGNAVRNVKCNWRVAGATCVALLQGSMDNVNWYTIQTLVSGINPVVATQDTYLRVQVTNNNAGTQTNEVWATFQV